MLLTDSNAHHSFSVYTISVIIQSITHLILLQELIQKANKLTRRKLIVWCLFS